MNAVKLLRADSSGQLSVHKYVEWPPPELPPQFVSTEGVQCCLDVELTTGLKEEKVGSKGDLKGMVACHWKQSCRMHVSVAMSLFRLDQAQEAVK